MVTFPRPVCKQCHPLALSSCLTMIHWNALIPRGRRRSSLSGSCRRMSARSLACTDGGQSQEPAVAAPPQQLRHQLLPRQQFSCCCRHRPRQWPLPPSAARHAPRVTVFTLDTRASWYRGIVVTWRDCNRCRLHRVLFSGGGAVVSRAGRGVVLGNRWWQPVSH